MWDKIGMKVEKHPYLSDIAYFCADASGLALQGAICGATLGLVAGCGFALSGFAPATAPSHDSPLVIRFFTNLLKKSVNLRLHQLFN